MRRRAAGVDALMLASTLSLTGCMPPFMDVCPAIGYISTVAVDANAYGDDILVQLCAGRGECSPAPGEIESASADLWGEENVGIWVFSFPSEVPDAVTVNVFDSAGALLDESSHELDWVHSTERCGGPSTTSPIVLAR